jgi:hypothetical protein
LKLSKPQNPKTPKPLERKLKAVENINNQKIEHRRQHFFLPLLSAPLHLDL